MTNEPSLLVRRPTAKVLSLLAATLLSGCLVYTSELTEVPPPRSTLVSPTGGHVPLVIESVTETFNGTPVVPMPAYEKSVADALRQSGIFSAVVESKLKHQAQTASFRLTLESSETLEYNEGAHTAGTILSFVTLQAASPFTIYTQHMTHTLAATLVTPDGQASQFAVTAKGHTTQSGPDLQPARTKLHGKLRKATLEGFVARMSELNISGERGVTVESYSPDKLTTASKVR